MEDLKNAINEIAKENIIKLVISNKVNKNTEYNKITFIFKEDRNKKYYQIEKYTDKQVFHENIDIDGLADNVFGYVGENYKQISAWSSSITFDLKISKKVKFY